MTFEEDFLDQRAAYNRHIFVAQNLYGIPSQLLNLSIIILIHKTQYYHALSFYRLYKISAITNFIWFVYDTVWGRQLRIAYFNHAFYKIFGTDYTLILIPFHAVNYYFLASSMFMMMTMQFNRLTCIMWPMNFEAKWRRGFPLALLFTHVLTVFCYLHLLVSPVRLRPTGQLNVYWNASEDKGRPIGMDYWRTIRPFFSNSQINALWAMVTTVVIITFTIITVYCLRTQTRNTRRIESKLFTISISLALIVLTLLASTIGFAFFKSFNQMMFTLWALIVDCFVNIPPWTMLATNSKIRGDLLRMYHITRFSKASIVVSKSYAPTNLAPTKIRP